jgi:hypothetical protein
MPAPGPILSSLTTGRIAIVTNAILAAFDADPLIGTGIALNAAGDTLKVTSYRDGYDESEKSKKEPDSSELPYLRVSYSDSAMKWENNHEHAIELYINYDIFIKGTHENDLTNLVEAIFNVMYPQDPTQRAIVFASFSAIAGLTRGTFTGGVSGVSGIGYAMHGLKARMRQRITITIPT